MPPTLIDWWHSFDRAASAEICLIVAEYVMFLE